MVSVFFAYALLSFGLLGHLALWVALFNRTHAFGIPRRIIQVSEKLHVLAMIGIPLVWASRLLGNGLPSAPISRLFADHLVEGAYFAVACGVLTLIGTQWAWRRLHERPSSLLRSSWVERHNVAQQVDTELSSGMTAKLLSFVPWNEMTKLAVEEKELELPRLDTKLDGLSILHLSDLHFTGKLRRDYFDFVVDRANELQADLVVVTGDIIDKEECLDWIPTTLGRLESRCGKYFILGNHDKRLSDVPALRRIISDCGFVDLGGRCELVSIEDRPLLLAGNEMPWFGPAPDVPSRDELDHSQEVLRILLSHSPDQLQWARENEFDLMLAGHTHGGQIRFPIIGPVVAPSRFGVNFASGIFDQSPTLLHVSRGISGLDPIRINCPPEVTRIVLRSCPTRPAASKRQPERAELAVG